MRILGQLQDFNGATTHARIWIQAQLQGCINDLRPTASSKCIRDPHGHPPLLVDQSAQEILEEGDVPNRVQDGYCSLAHVGRFILQGLNEDGERVWIIELGEE